MKETVWSVGIDIGTSTTQLVFSRLTTENRSAASMVPRIELVEKEVVYQSDIIFTPLLSQERIDAEKLGEWLRREYARAHMRPEDVKTGAVIITGETARMENAQQVLEAAGGMAGDFVVSTAGPELESFLAAKGAGTDRLSAKDKRVTANVDIGGGTSNIAVFDRGNLAGTACLDIGGRLMRVEGEKIAWLSPRLKRFLENSPLSIREGQKVDRREAESLCRLLASHLAQALGLEERTPDHAGLYTNGGKMLPFTLKVDSVTYSGGVGACMGAEAAQADPFRYGDIGPLLAKAVVEQPALRTLVRLNPSETIRATVVGAGIHTTRISGSTICCREELLPIRNLPVIRLQMQEGEDREAIAAGIRAGLRLYRAEGGQARAAIALSGESYRTFRRIQELAQGIAQGAEKIVAAGGPLVVIVEEDIGKALGNALKFWIKDCGILCIDGVHAGSGDYVDIGHTMAQGTVVPVVVKTLVLNAAD